MKVLYTHQLSKKSLISKLLLVPTAHLRTKMAGTLIPARKKDIR